MSITTVKVSDKGQIAIPQSIREHIGIEKGDELILIEEDNKILIEKAETSKLKDDFKDLLKLSELSLKKFWSSKEDDVWDKV